MANEEKVDELKTPGFFTEEVKSVMPEKFKEVVDPTGEPSTDEAPSTEGTPNEGNSPEGEESQKVVEPENKEEESVNPFLEPEKESKPISTIDDAVKELQELGYEVGEDKNIASALADLKQYKEDITKKEEEIKGLKSYEEFLSKMPDDLYKIVSDYANGKDYRAVMKDLVGGLVDFSVPFDKQDVRNLIEFYYPGKYSKDEDYQALKESPIYNDLVEMVKERYTEQRNEKIKSEEKIENTLIQNDQKINESIEASIDFLNKSGKKFDETTTSSIKQMMANNGAEFVKLFFNNDGTWKPDASLNIAKIIMHDSIVADYRKLLNKNQKLLGDLVSRSQDQRDVIGKPSGSHSDEEIKKQAESIVPNEAAGNVFK